MLSRLHSRFEGWIQAWLYGLRERHQEAIFANHVRSGRVVMGRFSYGTPDIRGDRNGRAVVRIGQFCSIGPGVILTSGGNHNPTWVSTFPLRIQLGLAGAFADGMPTSKGDVEVGNDVWLGMGVLVLSGVSIGHGAIVGANSVVAKDVPPYAIAVGNPARVIRLRFTEAHVEALLRIRWWDWPLPKILEAVPLLSSGQVEEFVNRFDGGPS